ncbi:hypothetical protein THASP1DRAFT_21984 [Thamnocephalis sphaerospora]|uniref:Uncharacterized protein n=1 Tax=Thamnocephalis sphaerospora TaxID=78915 RepID=A0A4P9XVJ1_9FUNG|nr:hypothetical protein THASP1DRAFT_21984 [Thamnocephalis sphaerospora]|eukprot:RKP10293.1 hypothetical protein THASP1DRAFT_21984 [Thamnocephalis sphaerospora]
MKLKRAFSFASRFTSRKHQVKDNAAMADGDAAAAAAAAATRPMSATSLHLASSHASLITNTTVTALPNLQAIALTSPSATCVGTPASDGRAMRKKSVSEPLYVSEIRRLLPDRIDITHEAATAIRCFAEEFVGLLTDHCDGPRRMTEGRRLEEALRELMIPEHRADSVHATGSAVSTTTSALFTPSALKVKRTRSISLLRSLLQSVAGARLHATYQMGVDYITPSSSWSDHSERLARELARVLVEQVVRHTVRTCVELVVHSERTRIGANEVLLALSADHQLGRAFSLTDLRHRLTDIVYADPMEARPSLTSCSLTDEHRFLFLSGHSRTPSCHTRVLSRQPSKFSLGASSASSTNAQELRAFMADPAVALLGARDDARDSQWSQVLRGLGSH